ncbi:hypothetical protein [Streptomyces canus]|uniref:hypothetical protein n=1 Tax=Streptomyces canus TaxID=58343 RepID=UPI0027D7D842|nr:hypothetical protein [Streptomyces canus]
MPNAYDVELAEHVHDELSRNGVGVGQVLTDRLAGHGEKKGYEPAPWTTRETCRSRSALWSPDETRQYATVRPATSAQDCSTSRIPDGVCTTGTGIRPSFA